MFLCSLFQGWDFPFSFLVIIFDVEEKLLGREGGTESRGGCGYLLSLSEDEMSETMKDTVHLPHGGMYEPSDSYK